METGTELARRIINDIRRTTKRLGKYDTYMVGEEDRKWRSGKRECKQSVNKDQNKFDLSGLSASGLSM